MASIQQSMNQLLGAVAGASTMGAYMYRQSNTFKARQAEKGVENINKQFSLQGEKTIEQATPEERARLLKAGEKGLQLREEAFETKPTAKRLENISKAEGSLKTLKEGITEAEMAEQAKADAMTQKTAPEPEPELKPITPTKEELELQKAQETVRRYIMGQDRIGSQQEQTLRYQQALQLIREKEGLN